MNEEDMLSDRDAIICAVQERLWEDVSDRLHNISTKCCSGCAFAVLALVMDDLDSDDRGNLATWLCDVVLTPT